MTQTLTQIMSTPQSSTTPKRPDRPRSRPTSGADPPGIDTDDAGLERLYDDLFGTPALRPRKGTIFSGVYELAIERPMEAEDAVEAARSEFYRGDHPFDYGISETAAAAGGPGR